VPDCPFLARRTWIGALLSPTDPVAVPIVSGPLAEKCIPERVRNAISFESGANDGLGYPFGVRAAPLTRLYGRLIGKQ